MTTRKILGFLTLKRCLSIKHWASLVAHMVKNLPAVAGDPGSIPGSGRSPEEGNDNLLQYSCLENPHSPRSLAGYSPWGRRVRQDGATNTLLFTFNTKY